MIIRLAAIICLILFSYIASANAWGHGKNISAINCPTFNTTQFTIGSAVVLSNCQIKSGIYGSLLVAVTGEVTCGPISDAEFNLVVGVGTGPYPTTGANFFGQISAGVLTVTSLVTPSLFQMTTGQTLFDNNSGSNIPNSASGSTLTITGQIDGIPGGIGHYSVSDGSLTILNELMWALNVAPVLGRPPSSIQISRDPLEQLSCQNGTTGIVTMTGALPAGAFNQTKLNVWIAILITSESVAGGLPQGASWNNGQITVIALGTQN